MLNLREKPYKIKSNIDYDKSFTNLINILEDCYNIYIKCRHDICHYKIINKYDICFILDKKSDAIEIINDIYHVLRRFNYEKIFRVCYN